MKNHAHNLFRKITTGVTAATALVISAPQTLFGANTPAKNEVAAEVESGPLKHISSSSDFESQVLNSNMPVLVDFYADWCGPCRMLSPVIKNLAEEFDGKAAIVKINVDKARGLASKYKVRGIPCVIIFKNGKEVERFVGIKGMETYKNALDKEIK